MVLKNLKNNLWAVTLLTLSAATYGQSEQLQSFSLSSVRLLDSPFLKAQQTDMKYILELDADRLLAPYLKEAGLTLLKDNYDNWENTGLDGHIGGHYLSALSEMYAATGKSKDAWIIC